jgi:PA domain
MRLLSLALVSALALTSACQKAASPDVALSALPDVTVPALSEKTMQDVTRELSLDTYEGRAPGSIGEEKTVAYLISKFKAAGLKPGNNGSWTQDVPLIEITAKNVSPLRISDRNGKAMSFAYGSEYVIGSYRETPKTDIKQSDMVFVGHGIVAPEKGWNDYASVDVKGKTVVVMVNDPDFENEGLDGPFGGKAMTYYGRWTYKYEEAARQGAAAVLIIHDTAPAAYGWNVVNSSWTGTQFLA